MSRAGRDVGVPLAIAGAMHETHRDYARECELPVRSQNMYSSFRAALLCLVRTRAVLDRSRSRRLSAILRTRAKLRALCSRAPGCRLLGKRRPAPGARRS